MFGQPIVLPGDQARSIGPSVRGSGGSRGGNGFGDVLGGETPLNKVLRTGPRWDNRWKQFNLYFPKLRESVERC